MNTLAALFSVVTEWYIVLTFIFIAGILVYMKSKANHLSWMEIFDVYPKNTLAVCLLLVAMIIMVYQGFRHEWLHNAVVEYANCKTKQCRIDVSGQISDMGYDFETAQKACVGREDDHRFRGEVDPRCNGLLENR